MLGITINKLQAHELRSDMEQSMFITHEPDLLSHCQKQKQQKRKRQQLQQNIGVIICVKAMAFHVQREQNTSEGSEAVMRMPPPDVPCSNAYLTC